MKKINWDSITSTNTNLLALENFAAGNLSGYKFYAMHCGTDNAGIVRDMIRNLGVTKSRLLAKRALSRRGITA